MRKKEIEETISVIDRGSNNEKDREKREDEKERERRQLERMRKV